MMMIIIIDRILQKKIGICEQIPIYLSIKMTGIKNVI